MVAVGRALAGEACCIPVLVEGVPCSALVDTGSTGLLLVTVGEKTLRHPVLVAAVQDLCILGLDFTRHAGCQLELQRETVFFKAALLHRVEPDTSLIRGFPSVPSPTSFGREEERVLAAVNQI